MGGSRLGTRRLSPVIFLFLLPQKHPAQGLLEYQPSCATHRFLNTIDCFEMLMRADGAFSSPFAFAAKCDLCRADFLRSCSHSVDIQVNSYIYIYINQIIVYIACLGWFVFFCMYSTSHQAGRPQKKYEPSISIIHKVHSEATGNCRRQQQTQTWRQNSKAVKKKCVIVLLVTQNFPAIHFSHFPQTLGTRS